MKIIPEKIWEKIRKDRLEIMEKQIEYQADTFNFCLNHEELRYVIGLGPRPTRTGVRKLKILEFKMPSLDKEN